MATESSCGVHPFHTTQWSDVARANDTSLSVKRQALDGLLRQYIPALRFYLKMKRKVRPDQIDDLIQGFVASRILEKDLIAQADRKRGKFRTFLLVSLERYAISEFRYRTAAKRSSGGTLSLEGSPEHASRAMDPKRVFDTEWAHQIVRQGLIRMRRACKSLGRDDEWHIFKWRILGPIYGRPKMAYQEVVQRLDLRSPSQVSKLSETSKRRFARALRAVIGEYAPDPDQIEDEINDLMRSLSGIGT